MSKAIRFDTSKTRVVIGRGVSESDRSAVEVVDTPIHCGELEVDCERALTLRCGSVEGCVNVNASPPGWVRYLEYARDEMQREALKRPEEYLD